MGKNKRGGTAKAVKNKEIKESNNYLSRKRKITQSGNEDGVDAVSMTVKKGQQTAKKATEGGKLRKAKTINLSKAKPSEQVNEGVTINNNATVAVDNQVSDRRRGRSRSVQRESQGKTDEQENSQEKSFEQSLNDEMIYDGDGIIVSVNTSDDEFGSETGSEDEENENLDDVVDDGDVRKISMLDDVFNDSISADSEITFHAKKKQTLSKADLKDDPEVQSMVEEMVKERIAEELKNYEEVFSARSKKGDKESKTPKGNNLRNSQVVSPVKSPSDTTIYRPALHKGEENANQLIKRISDIVENIRMRHQKFPAQQGVTRKVTEDIIQERR